MPSVPGYVGTITAPGSTGQQTYTITGVTDTVKAILVWWTLNTGDGNIAHAQFGWGFGTYRGGSVQQVFSCLSSADAGANNAGGLETGTSALCKLLDTAGTATDASVSLVSLGAGQFVLDWTDLPATGSTLLNYAVLCGTDFTDALATTFATVALTGALDITVASGFGQPDLILVLTTGTNGVATSDVGMSFQAALIGTGFGAGIKDGARRCTSYAEDEGTSDAEVAIWQQQAIALFMDDSTPGTEQGEIDLNPSSGWPTDGFEINRVTSTVQTMGVLALKGTFNKALSARTTRTSTGDDDYNVGFSNQKVAICWGGNIIPAAGSTSPDATNAQLGQFWIGACDSLGNEAWKAFSAEDGITTMDTYSYHTGAKTLQMHNADDASLLIEADGSFTGTNFRLNYNDIDATSREYNALVIGWTAASTAKTRSGWVNHQDPGWLFRRLPWPRRRRPVTEPRIAIA